MECRAEGTLDKAGPSLPPVYGALLGRRVGGLTHEGDHTGPAAGTLGTALGSLGTALIVDTGSSAGLFLRGAELWAQSLSCTQGGPGVGDGVAGSLFPSPLTRGTGFLSGSNYSCYCTIVMKYCDQGSSRTEKGEGKTIMNFHPSTPCSILFLFCPEV